MKPETPFLTVDGVVEQYSANGKFLGIILVERKFEPVGLALPGGFVDIGESLETAVAREVKEETNLDVYEIELLNAYSDPDRDARFHTVSVVYVCKANGDLQAGDDAKDAQLYKAGEIPYDKLVFDHRDIIEDYISQHHN